MEIHRTAFISTAHLSIQTRNWLEALDWDKEGPAGGPITYGWFSYCHDDNICSPSAAHAPAGEYPADLWACYEFMRAQSDPIHYVRFDSDANTVDGLPEYDDTPAPVDAAGILQVAS